MSLGAPLSTTEVIFRGQKRSICLTAKKSHRVSQEINLATSLTVSSSSLDDPVSPHNLPPICISVTKEEYMESIDLEYMDRYGRYGRYE